jgi:hypothetical protein
MKWMFTIIAGCLLVTGIFAQSPEKMSYQALIRDNNNQLVTNHAVGMKISILQGSATGTAVYVETHISSTNANGLVSLEIGNGTPVTGTFAAINLANGPYFIKTETDPAGGTNYTITGTSQLLSVPYALYAKTAGTTDTHAIGDYYKGGTIFWLDASRQHGLIAPDYDQSNGIQWDNGTSRITGTIGDGLYAGAMNTAIIVATQMADNQFGSFAAKVCADFAVTVDGVAYGDWYLPSKYELNLLYEQRDIVKNFGVNYYWSSTEYNDQQAWFQFFFSGAQLFNVKSTSYNVRAIRAF